MSRYELVLKNGVYILCDLQHNLDETVKYNRIKSLLFEHYKSNLTKYSNDLLEIINRLEKDNYFSIIEDFFSYKMTTEEIAEDLGKDTSTIKRNKKRLCFIIMRLLEEKYDHIE